jgi:hypothetical protein
MLARPDHDGDADPGQVLSPLKPVRIAIAGRPLRQAEAEEYHGTGRDIGQVVDGVTEQPDRAGQNGQQQLDRACACQSDRADGNRSVRSPSVLRSVPCPRQRELLRRIPYASDLVHLARLPS